MSLPGLDAGGNPLEAVTGTSEQAATAAAAGSTSADATVLSAAGIQKVTGADGTKGVRLPAASPGRTIKVVNGVASALKVYAPTGGTVNGGGVDAAFSQSSSKNATYFSTDALTWFAVLSA